MNVKNIKSFIEFYQSMGVSTFIGKSQRFSNTQFNSVIQKKVNHAFINKKSSQDKVNKLNILKNSIEQSDCGLKDIATNIVSVVSGVSSPAIKKVSRQPFPLDELSQQQYPAVLVQTIEETKEDHTIELLAQMSLKIKKVVNTDYLII